MGTIFSKTAALAAVIGCLGLMGCQGEPTLPTEYVEGVVTLDGSPVEGASVTFVPVDMTTGISAVGTTDANGVYKLTATQGVDDKMPAPEAGAMPGDYVVTIRKVEAADYVSREEAEAQGIKPTEYAPGQEPKPKYIVPKKYLNPSSTDLKVTVKEGKNDIPFDLKSK